MQNNHKQVLFGFLSALGVGLYTLLVSLIMNNAEKWFRQPNKVFGPMAALMLLVFSVAVVGSLIFGRPTYLVITGEKSTGIKQLFYNLAWLAIFVIAGFALLSIYK